jgi:hypothetical protein
MSLEPKRKYLAKQTLTNKYSEFKSTYHLIRSGSPMAGMSCAVCWKVFDCRFWGLGPYISPRHWKDHFKSDLRSDQDHRLKKYLRSDQDQIFLKNDLDLKSRSKIIFCLKSPLFEYFKKKIALLIFKVNFFSVLNCLASSSLFLGMDELCCERKKHCRVTRAQKKNWSDLL